MRGKTREDYKPDRRSDNASYIQQQELHQTVIQQNRQETDHQHHQLRWRWEGGGGGRGGGKGDGIPRGQKVEAAEQQTPAGGNGAGDEPVMDDVQHYTVTK